MAKKFKKISFVIPALNEEKTIAKTLKEIPKRQLRKAGLETEVVVVDSNSTDDTVKIARALGARVVNEPRKGYGLANLKGFREARGDLIVKADADGTYPLNKTLWFIRPILEGKADFVIGNRFSGRMEKGAMSVVNVVGNKFITSNVNLLFHVGVWDTQCGMRAFTRDAFRKMSLKCTGMEFGPELVIEAHAKGLRLKELPIDYRKRGGAAKLNALRDGIRDITYLYKRFLGFA